MHLKISDGKMNSFTPMYSLEMRKIFSVDQVRNKNIL
jgi:hypothetical protein